MSKKLTLKEDNFISELKKNVNLKIKNKDYTPSYLDVKNVVEGLKSNLSLSIIAKKIRTSNKTDNEKIVLDIVAVFGTWLTHSEGRGLPKGKSKNVTIPEGFSPNNRHKRDVSKALTRILLQNPSDETISRFVARTYNTRSASIDHAVVAGVWGFAKRDRLELIENVSNDSVFQSQVIEAYNFLKLNLEDALTFIDNLYSIKVSKNNLDKIHDQLKKFSWLNEIEFNEILKIVELSIEDDSYMTLLNSKFNEFRNRIQSLKINEKYVSISELTAGQIRRICAQSGLVVESDQEKRSVEMEIRQTLKELGLSNDQDLLMPEAIRAFEKGRLPDFWQVLQNRLDGDLTWSEQLAELTN